MMGAIDAAGTRRTVAAVVLFAAVVGLSVSRIGLIDSVLGVDAGASWVMTDFYSGGYYPVRALLDGENPYDRARFLELYPVADGFPPYLPATLALHLPFGLLPRAPAAVAYFVATIALTLVLAWSALRLGGGGREIGAASVLVAAAIILVTRPGHWNLMVGQRTLLYVLGTYAAVRFLHERPVLAGLGLALAMIKPTFGVPLAILMLAAGGWRPVAYGALLTIATNGPLLPVVAGRAGGLQPFLTSLFGDYDAWQGITEIDPTSSLFRIELPAALSRWIGRDIGAAPAAATGALVLICGVVAVHRLARFDDPVARDLTAGVVGTTVLLYVQHVGYDLLLLTWPCVAFVVGGIPRPLRARPLPLILAACYLAVSLNWFATWSFTRHTVPGGVAWQAAASINTVAVLGIWLISLAAAARSTRIAPVR